MIDGGPYPGRGDAAPKVAWGMPLIHILACHVPFVMAPGGMVILSLTRFLRALIGCSVLIVAYSVWTYTVSHVSIRRGVVTRLKPGNGVCWYCSVLSGAI